MEDCQLGDKPREIQKKIEGLLFILYPIIFWQILKKITGFIAVEIV